MKTRMGFVSNSSSSSFVVAFPKKPETEQELRDMMFPPATTEIQPYEFCEAVPVKDIVEHVFGEIQKQGRTASVARIQRYLEGYAYDQEYRLVGSIHDRVKREDYGTEQEYWDAQNKLWAEDEKRHKEYEAREAKKFKEKHPNGFVFVTSYGDNDGRFFSTMEHGGIFWNLDGYRVSNH